MEFTCYKINMTDSGIGVEVHFENLNGDSELYFLIQRHFDEYDRSSYIETHNFDLAGHYIPKIKLRKTKSVFKFGNNQVVINYEINDDTFKELEKFLKILGSVE